MHATTFPVNTQCKKSTYVEEEKLMCLGNIWKYELHKMKELKYAQLCQCRKSINIRLLCRLRSCVMHGWFSQINI